MLLHQPLQAPVPVNTQPADTIASPLVPVLPPVDSTSFYYHYRLQHIGVQHFWFQQMGFGLGSDLQVEQAGVLANRNALLLEKGQSPIVAPKLQIVEVKPKETVDSQSVSVPLADTLHLADSTQLKADTAVAQVDSLAVVDSILPSDSLWVADSISQLDTLQVQQIPQQSAVDTLSLVHTKRELPDWLTGFKFEIQYSDAYLMGVLFSALMLTIAKVSYPRFIGTLWSGIISYSESYKTYRDYNFLLRRFFAITGLVVTLNISLFFTHLFHVWQIDISPWNGLADFGIIFAAVNVLNLLKQLMLRTVGQLFMAYRMAEEYWFQQSLINRFVAMWALPVLASLPYLPEWLSPYFIDTIWALMAIAYIFRVIRGIRMAIEKQVSVLYMIFYFCTLEIIPVLVLVKFFISTWM